MNGLSRLEIADRRSPAAILDTPWKGWNELWRWLAYPRIRLLFGLNGILWQAGWRIYGLPIIQKHHRSQMRFGPGLQLRSSLRSNPVGPNHPVILSTRAAEATLVAGANLAMTGGAIIAVRRIEIGDNVIIGANSTLVDTDFHPADPGRRRLWPNDGAAEQVIVENDAFIGMNCLILKGVRLGRGCVIGAGSVVTGDVPPYTVAAGNPARPVKGALEPNPLALS
jgi:hypothetical protein